MPHEESGIEELRRVAEASKYTREDAFDGLTAEECINLFRACWASEWDIFPDTLPEEHRREAAKAGKLSEGAKAWLTEKLS